MYVALRPIFHSKNTNENEKKISYLAWQELIRLTFALHQLIHDTFEITIHNPNNEFQL